MSGRTRPCVYQPIPVPRSFLTPSCVSSDARGDHTPPRIASFCCTSGSIIIVVCMAAPKQTNVLLLYHGYARAEKRFIAKARPCCCPALDAINPANYTASWYVGLGPFRKASAGPPFGTLVLCMICLLGGCSLKDRSSPPPCPRLRTLRCSPPVVCVASVPS